MIELIIIIFIPILIFYLANQLNKTEKSVNLPEQFKNLTEKFKNITPKSVNLPEQFKNITPKSVIFIPTFIAIIAQFFIKYENIAVTIGIFCILIATIALFKYYNEMKTKNSAYKGIIPIGIALGILAVTRQDMISYMWGLFFWAMFWAGMADVEGLALSLKNRAIKGAKQGIFLTAIIIISSIFIVIFINLITISSSSTEQFNNLTEKTNISTSIFNDLRIIIQNIIKYFSKYSTINLPKTTTIYGVLFYFPPISAIFSLISLIFLNRKQIIKANTPLFWKEMLIINLTLNIFNYTLTGNTLSTILPSILFATLTIFNIKKAIQTLINQNKTGKSGNLTP